MGKSWLEIPEQSEFSLANIPFGVASFATSSSTRRCVTAIGLNVVDLHTLQDAGAFDDITDLDANAFVGQETLNVYMRHPPSVWPQVRQRIIDLFNGTNDFVSSNAALQKSVLHESSAVHMHLPAQIGDYTDFYSSREHATNVGTMFRGKDNALQPNWLHLPVGYHGRASTVFCTGQPIVRPCGQLQKDAKDPKQGSIFGPCNQLDFELEVAFFVGGTPNDGPMSIGQAKERIFGFVLMNDWSARDIQKWEYVPLGPFTSKNFATTISPWIVPTESLEKFVTPTSAVTQDNPEPLGYLRDPNYGSFNIQLSVAIQSKSMTQPAVICKSNFANLYWNAVQQLVHHSVTGCVMNPGDLLGSGTISGQTEDSYGSMLELSWRGSRPVKLGDSGETRMFLQDGDTIIMKGICSSSSAGRGKVGFGVCQGQILPAGTVLSTVDENAKAKSKSRFKDFKLYSYWKSSSSWRVRTVLKAKGLPFELIPVALSAGEHKSDSFLKKNPLGQVPLLEFTDTVRGRTQYLSQSLAIIEFLEESFPTSKALMPSDPSERASAMAMVEIINAAIQPLQNRFLISKLEAESEGKIVATQFAKESISKGFRALELLIQQTNEQQQQQQQDDEHHHPHHRNGPFVMGNFCPSIVEVYLIPQIFNGRDYGVDIDNEFPILAAIDNLCKSHPWFVASHPDSQPDAGT